MKNLYIEEAYVNVSQNALIGNSGVQESRFTSIKDLFAYCLEEHGRCTGKIYIDDTSGNSHHIGWIFSKKVKYTDVDEYYTSEVWVTIHEKPEKHIVKHFYKYLNS